MKKEVLYLTSVNYTEAGPYTLKELTFFCETGRITWDTYILRLGETVWHHVRDIPALREILLDNFLPQSGAAGPAGGFIIRDDRYNYAEAAPCDAGIVPWREAEELCENYSLSGFAGWRLPTATELREIGNRLRGARRAGLTLETMPRSRTFETIWHWSAARKDEAALAVVTQENEDRYQPRLPYPMGGYSGGYFFSEKGPWIGSEKEFPLTDSLPVRPVRDVPRKAGQISGQETGKTFSG